MALDDNFKPETKIRFIIDEERLEQMRKINNPHNQSTGHYTGRCENCHSTNLWDDNTHYGCRDCGAVYFC
jgi:hypothetical protein